MIGIAKWEKVSDNIIDACFYVVINGMYVSSYNSANGDISLTKKKSRAKDFYAQEDGRIYQMPELLEEYPEAQVFAVRESRLIEESKVTYTEE